jgi:uroporphyrinogen decarboxylase
MPGAQTKPLLRALAGETLQCPPWWLMRQAGRYLPEYRALRAEAPDFVSFCLTPELAAEATLQPVRRFGMDAAILFADILLVPQALGQKLWFGEDGPMLEPIRHAGGNAKLDIGPVAARLEPVCQTIRLCRGALPEATTLIGFAGAPWTVATYMVEGGASRDYRNVKAWAYGDPAGFSMLVGLITEATIAYLSAQIEAGVEAVQLFDSWAGVLPEPEFRRWVIEPTRRIVKALKARYPAVPIIGFPRGGGLLYERYIGESGVDAVGLDTTVPLDYARDRLQPRATLQGNLDPVLLLVGGEPLRQAVREIRASLGKGPFIFNLGHGVLQQTPPEHVAILAQLLAEPVEVE